MKRKSLLTKTGRALKKSLAVIALAAMVAAVIATLSLEAKADLGPSVFLFSDTNTLLVYACDDSLETVLLPEALLPDPYAYSSGPMVITVFRIRCKKA